MTTVWRKVADAGDPRKHGATGERLGGYVKVALTLAAYRGTDTTNPVASDHGRARARKLDVAHLAVGRQQHRRCVAGVLLVGQEQWHHDLDGSPAGK